MGMLVSALASCGHTAVHALVGSGPRLCENSARYDRTRNFEACGHAQSKKTQKFILRSVLRPNQISFSHSLGQNPTTRSVPACLLPPAADIVRESLTPPR